MDTQKTMNQDLMKKLEKVVNINKDAVEFYSKAKEKVQSAELRETFGTLSNTHQSILDRVDTLLQQADASRERDDASETIMGTSNRMFGELVSKLSSKPDETLVRQLEEAEDRCLQALQEVLKDESIDASTRQTLEKELEKTRGSHEHMKDLKRTIAA